MSMLVPNSEYGHLYILSHVARRRSRIWHNKHLEVDEYLGCPIWTTLNFIKTLLELFVYFKLLLKLYLVY